MSKKFISEFLPNLTSGELDSSQSSLEIKNAAETLTAVESESGRDMSDDGDKLDTLDKINPIADKETAYALTGVAVGTVYKTDDTGQSLEFLDRFPLPDIKINHPVGTTDFPPNTLMPYANQYNGKGNYTPTNIYCQWSGTKWEIWNSGLSVEWESTEDVASPDLVTTWTAVSAAAQAIDPLTSAMVHVYEPRNWKHDGVILVRDNDEKQLLTNLPDTQQVEVVGEGGRVERFNGDGARSATQDFTTVEITAAGNDAGGNPYAALYHWDASLGRFQGNPSNIFHNGTRWQHWDNNFFVSIDAAAGSASVHPADADWSGTVFDGEIFALPEATESNWFAIVNTIELYGNVAYTTITINGVLIEPINTDIRVGWIKPTDSMLSNFGNPWYVQSIDGFAESSNTGNFQGGDGMTLPQPFPSGATVVIRNT